MALCLDRVINKRLHAVSRIFEPMGEGLLLVRVKCGVGSLVPNHWFFESGSKPPLDIALNAKTGVLESIKFFFQDEVIVEEASKVVVAKTSVGTPVFDISMFTAEKYQEFELETVHAFLTGASLYFMLENKLQRNIKVDLCLDVSKTLSLFFGVDKCFLGFALHDLISHEIKALGASKIIS